MKSKIPIILSSVAVVTSFASIAFVLFRIPVMDLDIFSGLIGVLSILVTVLIGYQIINVLDIKNKLKEFGAIEKRIGGDMTSMEKRLKTDLAISLSSFAFMTTSAYASNKNDIIDKHNILHAWLRVILLSFESEEDKRAEIAADIVLRMFPYGYETYDYMKDQLLEVIGLFPQKAFNPDSKVSKMIARIGSFNTIIDTEKTEE